MGLINKGYVKPITPMKIYPFEDIVSSFRYIRGGSHIGKIVISNGKEADVDVEVRLPPSSTLTSLIEIGSPSSTSAHLPRRCFLSNCGWP